MELLVTRQDLKIVELARMLGRTPAAVEQRKTLVLADPKWRKAAGVHDS